MGRNGPGPLTPVCAAASLETVARAPITKPTEMSVEEYIAALPDERQADARTLAQLMAEVSGEPAQMWGSSIIGFGLYHYRYPTGTEGDSAVVSFAPRKQNLVVYLVGDVGDRDAEQLARLGPHQTGKGCLYLRRLTDVDLDVLGELVADSVEAARRISGEAEQGH